MDDKPKFTIEKIDEKTARKIDVMESVTIINIDILRKEKERLEAEIADRQKTLTEIDEVISEFEKQ